VAAAMLKQYELLGRGACQRKISQEKKCRKGNKVTVRNNHKTRKGLFQKINGLQSCLKKSGNGYEELGCRKSALSSCKKL